MYAERLACKRGVRFLESPTDDSITV